ncbi:hypothetical protein [Vibrio quintilis]|uniref:Uncharacterized protein n=1 Tax=Vibrio quintilis TaxID=1117707 RepID=A0A1M7YPS3_9VIBR|nr:hypothetical protein [Vibrio quintilis]SHO54486.1 hypothetical protein VQ7734_00200 [Vibrio quintilis]
MSQKMTLDILDVIGKLDRWKKGDPRINEEVTIVITHDGQVPLSNKLASETEIDEFVNAFISDLEIIRIKAKRKLNNNNAKVRNS